MIKPNHVAVTVYEVYDSKLVRQKPMDCADFKREFLRVKFHVKNVKKLLIDYINEPFRRMNIVNN